MNVVTYVGHGFPPALRPSAPELRRRHRASEATAKAVPYVPRLAAFSIEGSTRAKSNRQPTNGGSFERMLKSETFPSAASPSVTISDSVAEPISYR